MAHKQGGGSTKNNRDSKSKSLEIKRGSGYLVRNGEIIVRQNSYHDKAGENVGIAKNYSLFALIDGVVKTEFNKNFDVVYSVEPYWVHKELCYKGHFTPGKRRYFTPSKKRFFWW